MIYDLRKQHSVCVVVVSVLFNLPVFASPPDNVPADMAKIASQSVICKFNDQVLPANSAALAQKVAKQQGAQIRHIYSTVINGFSAMMNITAAENLQANNPKIEYCVANSLVTTGARGGEGGKPGQVNSQITPWGVARVGGPIDGTGLVAWIIDSGIDLDHPDLNVDAARGIDVVNATAKGKYTIDDVSGHGTHVSGTLAAIDNDRDVVGVAAGATVVPVRVLSASSTGYVDDVIAGMDYVASQASPLDVANMSLWGWDHNRALHDAAYNLADYLPVITIAGNGGSDINDEPTEPGHVEHPNLFTVSAIYSNDVFVSGSSYGYAGDWTNCSVNYPNDPYPCATVDYAAPGHDITSLKPGGGLATWWGTSMAAPHVAGIILLMQKRVANPDSDGVAIDDPDSYPDPIVHY